MSARVDTAGASTSVVGDAAAGEAAVVNVELTGIVVHDTQD